MSPSGVYVATGGDDGVLRVWKVKYVSNNINGLAMERELAMHSAQINSVGFTADSSVVFSGSSDHTCRLFSVRDGKQLQCLSFTLPRLNQQLSFPACA
jgi:WD40 repeat protein